MHLTLNEQEYINKVYGGWMGKNIGGTLGGPMEGQMELMNWTFYSQKFDGPMPNDDLDLQLVWLHALEQYGVDITSAQLGQEWLEHVFFPFDEYGYALTNLRKGLQPPVCGSYNNPFTNCMGSPIRSEIWAMVSPGLPEAAARFAYYDAVVDHAGGEGVYGEIFFAALESAAFLESDRETLLDIAMSCIPPQCRTYKALSDLRKWHKEGLDWVSARNKIIEFHGSDNFTDAPQNIAFTILGWLYGEDFGDAILKATNCGYDTDCTAATLGALLGIICGADQIPKNWIAPIGEDIQVSAAVKGFSAPKNLKELTQRTVAVARKVLAANESPVTITATEPTNTANFIMKTDGIRQFWDTDFYSNTFYLPAGTKKAVAIEVAVRYENDIPAIGAFEKKALTFTVTNHSTQAWEGSLRLVCPCGWSCSAPKEFHLNPAESLVWDAWVLSDRNVHSSYPIRFDISRTHDHMPWATHSVEFFLASGSTWNISRLDGSFASTVTACYGNRIPFEAAFSQLPNGTYSAQTTIYVPSKREANLICATASPAKLSLDGKELFCSGETLFMPAYHRCPEEKRSLVVLEEGQHVVCIQVQKKTDPLDVYFIVTAPGDTSSPGNYYNYNDIDIL